MSPPGKRRHNELNAAPPPETPRRTGKPGETTDRENVHSGESFCIRGKTCLFGEPRGTIPPRYTSSPPAGGAVSLRLGQARVLVPTGNQFNTAPLLRSPQRGRLNERLLPRTRKLSPLCTISLWVVASVLPVPRGVSGGGAALSSLCRRFPGGDIMNLISRRNPLSGLSFSLFFFLRRKKKRFEAAAQS